MATTTLTVPRIAFTERMDFAGTMNFARTKPPVGNREVHPFLMTGELRPEEAFRTGTIGIYEKPGKKFGMRVEYHDVIVNIPNFQGLRDSLLVVNYPNYTFENGVLTILKEDFVQVVKNHPRANGWYLPHEVTMMPQGEALHYPDTQSANVLWLSRSDKTYVGSVVRAFSFDVKRWVDLSCKPEEDLLVAFVRRAHRQ